MEKIKVKSFSFKVMNKDAHSYLFYSILYLKTQPQQLGKEIKGIQIWMKEVKLSLFADDMILYTENHQKTIGKKWIQ